MCDDLQGQFTSSIYTLIKENKFAEAISHLNIEVQARFPFLSSCAAC